MAGYKKPSWMVAKSRAELKLNVTSRSYTSGGFQPRYTNTPSGAYNPGGGFEQRDMPQPSGEYNKGRFELRDVQRPSGAYTTGTKYEAPSGKDERDPWGAYSFSIMLDGVEIGSFLECSGMKSTAEVHEIEEGGMNHGTHKRAGRSKWENLILKHGECEMDTLHAWRERWLNDGFEERTETKLAIVLRDNDGMELRRFDVARPWPVSWEGPGLNGGGSELAVSTLEIAHDGLFGGVGSQPNLPEPDVDPVPKKLDMDPVQFELASAELTPEGEATVDEMSEQLDEHPDVEELWVEGHTCNLGSYALNKNLSEERAAAVAGRLKSQHPDKDIKSKGYSYDHPVASNANDAGRIKNRRTEVWTEARSGKRAGEM